MNREALIHNASFLVHSDHPKMGTAGYERERFSLESALAFRTRIQAEGWEARVVVRVTTIHEYEIQPL